MAEVDSEARRGWRVVKLAQLAAHLETERVWANAPGTRARSSGERREIEVDLDSTLEQLADLCASWKRERAGD